LFDALNQRINTLFNIMADQAGKLTPRQRLDALRLKQAETATEMANVRIEELTLEIAELKKLNNPDSSSSPTSISSNNEVELLAQIQQLNSTIESLKIEKESADAAQLDTVWIESSHAQSLISERVKTITQTQIDLAVEAKMKEDMDAWFSEVNDWCWKKNPLLMRIVDHVRTRIAPAVPSNSFNRESAINDYFAGPNEHLWKAQPAVAEHVRIQVLKAQRTAVSDFLSNDAWMTHPTIWTHVRTQRKEAIDDYFINEHTWKSDPRIE
jgi:hypothetical protein